MERLEQKPRRESGDFCIGGQDKVQHPWPVWLSRLYCRPRHQKLACSIPSGGAWSSLGSGQALAQEAKPSQPYEKRQGVTAAVGHGGGEPYSLSLAPLKAFSSRGYRSRLVTNKLPVPPLQPLTPDV